jgi:hypothetical protein
MSYACILICFCCLLPFSLSRSWFHTLDETRCVLTKYELLWRGKRSAAPAGCGMIYGVSGGFPLSCCLFSCVLSVIAVEAEPVAALVLRFPMRDIPARRRPLVLLDTGSFAHSLYVGVLDKGTVDFVTRHHSHGLHYHGEDRTLGSRGILPLRRGVITFVQSAGRNCRGIPHSFQERY